MGLTVHFQLSAPGELTEANAKQIVTSLHRKAVRLQGEGWVDHVHPITSDRQNLEEFALRWLMFPVPGQEDASTGVEVLPLTGFLFVVSVGRDYETLRLGLCRYPAAVRHDGKNVPTNLGREWGFAGFCKTQFASLPGWEYFARCHCAVVHLLASCQSPQLQVKISDEGEYWPQCSLKRLRENLDQMNGIVAGAAAALRDAFPGADGKNAVHSPIFAHPRFEHLEAAGEARFGPELQKLRAILSDNDGPSPRG